MVNGLPDKALFLIAEFAPKVGQVATVCKAMAAGSEACPPKAVFVGWYAEPSPPSEEFGRPQLWQGWTCGVPSVTLKCVGPLRARVFDGEALLQLQTGSVWALR